MNTFAKIFSCDRKSKNSNQMQTQESQGGAELPKCEEVHMLRGMNQQRESLKTNEKGKIID